MKLRYLLPFLFLPFLSQGARAQIKAEANFKSLDVKTPYIDVSARDTFGLQDIVNIRGDAQLKYGNNIAYVIRNGALNHLYGGNLDIAFLRGYYNRSRQNNRRELGDKIETPIGPVLTRTEITNENTSEDFGAGLSYRDFSISYEQGNGESKIDGSTVITIAGNESRVPFSSSINTESRVYGIGFKNDFFKFIQNRQEEREQNEEEFKKYLAKVSYPFIVSGIERANLSAYYSEDFFAFLNLGPFRNSNIKLLRDVDVNLSYNGRTNGFRATLSTSNLSVLHQRDFELGLENALRIAPRARDAVQETRRRYLADMFFTQPFSGEIGIEKDSTGFRFGKGNITANLNLKYFFLHYSEDSKTIGLKFGPAIATLGKYGEKKGIEARVGVFFGRIKH